MFQTATKDDETVFTFPARMDTLTCQKCETDLQSRICATPGQVLFDMTGVAYVASSFLRLCLQTVQKIGKERFRMANVTPEVKKVFMISGMDSLIKA